MDVEGFYLTPDDRDSLRALLAEWKRGNLSIKNRPAVPEELGHTPEVYLAWPHTDIPALAEASTGTAYDDTPGSASCGIHRLIDVFSIPISITPTPVVDKTVYNFSSVALPKHKWVLAVRDKYGTWVAVPLEDSTSSVDLIKRIGFHARLTDSASSGTPGTPGYTTGQTWNFRRLTLSGSIEIDDPAYPITTTYPAIPLALDSSFVVPVTGIFQFPRIGMRVWMWESKATGKYEFIPIGYADGTHPGLVSLEEQTLGDGNKTFRKGVTVSADALGGAYPTSFAVGMWTSLGGTDVFRVYGGPVSTTSPTVDMGTPFAGTGTLSVLANVYGSLVVGYWDGFNPVREISGELTVYAKVYTGVGTGNYDKGKLFYPSQAGEADHETALELRTYPNAGGLYAVFLQPKISPTRGGLTIPALSLAGAVEDVDFSTGGDIQAGRGDDDSDTTDAFVYGNSRGKHDRIYYTDWRDSTHRIARFRGGIWTDEYSGDVGTGTATGSPLGPPPPPPPPPPILYYCVVPLGQDCTDPGAGFSCVTDTTGFTVCSGPYASTLECVAACGSTPGICCSTAIGQTATLTIPDGPYAGTRTGTIQTNSTGLYVFFANTAGLQIIAACSYSDNSATTWVIATHLDGLECRGTSTAASCIGTTISVTFSATALCGTVSPTMTTP